MQTVSVSTIKLIDILSLCQTKSVYFVFTIKKIFSAKSIQILSDYSNGDKDVISP